jgi:hypothetical protein
MRRLPFLLLTMAGSYCETASGQRPVMNEAAAKEAVHLIVRHSGLLPNFTVLEDHRIASAGAYIKGKERIIAYDPDFISAILDSTGTDLAAVSILAHEIAHHLLGHTLDPEAVHPGDELACDRYSGFILFHLGATLEETLAAIEVAGNVHGTSSHPPRHARAEAVRQGWEDARDLALGEVREPFVVDRSFQYVVRFAGDPNTYYVDAEGCLVWFDNYAAPIELGAFDTSTDPSFAFVMEMIDRTYRIDAHYTIWRAGAMGMQMKVGSISSFH